jgi:hypothetical protein
LDEILSRGISSIVMGYLKGFMQQKNIPKKAIAVPITLAEYVSELSLPIFAT